MPPGRDLYELEFVQVRQSWFLVSIGSIGSPEKSFDSLSLGRFFAVPYGVNHLVSVALVLGLSELGWHPF